MQVNTLGLGIAAVSVITSGMQQILCGTVQRKHNLSSTQLLANTAPIQVTVVPEDIKCTASQRPDMASANFALRDACSC